MNAELWRSELAIYGFMILNCLVVVIALVWAFRQGHLADQEQARMAPLGLGELLGEVKENGNGK